MAVVRTSAPARNLVVILMGTAALAACATPNPQYSVRQGGGSYAAAGKPPSGAGGRYKLGEPYQVAGVWYVPKESPTTTRPGSPPGTATISTRRPPPTARSST